MSRAIRRFPEDVEIPYDIRAFARDLVAPARPRTSSPTSHRPTTSASSKQLKLALVAGMHCLAGLFDTLLREDRTRRPEPPSRELEVAA